MQLYAQMGTLVVYRWICNRISDNQDTMQRASLRWEGDGDEDADYGWPDSTPEEIITY